MTWSGLLRRPWRRVAVDRFVLLGGAAVVLLFAFAARPVSSAPTPSEVLLVADLRGHALVIFDLAAPDDARRVALEGGPHELVALPDGRIAVSLEQYGRLALVDLETDAVEYVETGGLPHGLAVDVGTSHLLVTDRSIGAVRRFSVETWVEATPLPAAGWPHAVAYSPRGEVVVALASADAIQVDGRRFDAPRLSETVAVAPDGRIATAGAIDGVVVIFDASGALIERYEVGGRPVRVAFDAAGERLAVALSAAGAVALVERGGVTWLEVGGVPDGLAFSGDGRWLYASDIFGGRITVVDTARAEVVASWRAGESIGAIMVLDAR
jgi:YD repeat-containing protein